MFSKQHVVKVFQELIKSFEDVFYFIIDVLPFPIVSDLSIAFNGLCFREEGIKFQGHQVFLKTLIKFVAQWIR